MNTLRMSPDEVFAMFVAGMFAVATWAVWYARPVAIAPLGGRGARHRAVSLAPLVGMVLLFAVLRSLAADDVRNDWRYLGFYSLLGAAWIGAFGLSLPLFGVSALDDVHERGNEGAAWAVGGATVAVALAFAGGNVGNGPGWWVVMFSAGLATGALLLVWLVLDALTAINDSVTIDRDTASGMRLGGLLVGSGVIVGRAAAGDWISAADTVRDFAMASWPVLALVALAVIVEARVRPTPERPLQPVRSHGVALALLYVGVGLAFVTMLGVPA